jgi:hypothetical protein
MKTYSLEPSTPTRMFWIGPAIAAVIFPLLILFLAFAAPKGPPAILALLPFAFGASFLVVMLRMPTRIEVADDGSMEWIAPIRRIRVLPSDVVSITPNQRTQGCLVLVHTSGRFSFVNQFTGFHELLTDLKRANPSVELRGC